MKTSRFFALGGLLILAYSVLAHYYVFSVEILMWVDNFAATFRELFLLASLLLLLLAVGGSSVKSNQNDETASVHSVRVWWIGFGTMLVIPLALAIYVNPHARFSSDKYPPVIPGARKIKMDLYMKLDSPPDVVIMGSSRAFTISPAYVEEKTGYSAFNMAVESGGSADYFVQTNYLLESGLSPRVLLIEIHQNSFGDVAQTWEIQPVALVPYMTWNGAVALGKASLEDVFSLRSLSDSIYLMLLSEERIQMWTINLDERGLGVRTPPTYEEYKQLLSDTIKSPTKNNVYCKRLVADGKDVFESMIELAQKNGIGVVVYESPMNFTFYDITHKRNPEGFDKCRKLLSSYLLSLAESYPNVFFQDLSVYDPISKLREDGYYDAVHLRPEAAEMVIDTLLPEIEAAMAWSLQQAQK